MTNTILVNQSKALRLMQSTLRIFLTCHQYHDGIWLNKMLICLNFNLFPSYTLRCPIKFFSSTFQTFDLNFHRLNTVADVAGTNFGNLFFLGHKLPYGMMGSTQI